MASPKGPEASRELARQLQRADRRGGQLIPADKIVGDMNDPQIGRYTVPEPGQKPIDDLTPEQYENIRQGTHDPTHPGPFVDSYARAKGFPEGSEERRKVVRAAGYDIAHKKIGEYANGAFPDIARERARRGPDPDRL